MSTRTQYEADLAALKESLARMSRLSADAVEDALEALCTADAEEAKGIIKGDTEVNRMERDIEHRCMTLLLRQQPVASDLRFISAAMKVVTDVERIGDHAADIAEIVPHLAGVRNKAELDELVESSLRGAALWDEVKDRLRKSALGLSGGQQQRLCIARALAVKPEVLLMDEPTSALDPGSTMKVEELMSELKKNYTVVIVTHNMQQAARISDRTAFFLLGELVECGPTSEIFSTPKDKRTEDYISGRFG